MSRRELREQVFKLLFRVEFNPLEEMPEQIQFFLEDQEIPMEEKDCVQIREKYEHIIEKLENIDELINEEAECWTTNRMGKVELSILRLAVYEIKYDEDIPAGVAINEAVELSKKFGQEDSYRFINGILAKFAA